MKNKKVLSIIFIIIIIFIVLISKNMTKKFKNGNNMSSQEIVDNILNINSYIAEIEVQVKSNKNENKYIMKQEYNTENGCVQEIMEPQNLAGIKITKKDGNLNIENTELNLKKIFDNYSELENNDLDLNLFLNEYKNNSNSNFEEKDEKIIMTIKSNKNKYINKKILYIDKTQKKPEKMLVQDDNQNTTIIIKYNKIELK